jgi:hypothetical protein
MTRKGKIARLPRHIRDQLNSRLDDGEQGARLVEWLNGLPEVNLVLERNFDGQPINEQNLTDWKQGGFLDWQQLQQSREWVRAVADEADQVTEEAGLMPLSDRLSSVATLALGKLMRELAAGAVSDTTKHDGFLRVLKELGRVRRADLEAARLYSQFEHIEARRSRREVAPQSGQR